MYWNSCVLINVTLFYTSDPTRGWNSSFSESPERRQLLWLLRVQRIGFPDTRELRPTGRPYSV